MSINSVPLWAVNSDRAILADGTIGLPSLRFKNSSSSGIHQSNCNVCISSSGTQAAFQSNLSNTDRSSLYGYFIR